MIVVPAFSLMAFASILEPLRSANLMSGRRLYAWTLYSPDGGVLESSGGLPILTEPLERLSTAEPADHDPDLIVVCAGLTAEEYRSPALEACLRRAARRGKTLTAVSTASFILAHAGLLEGRRCTVHWDFLDAFIEAFPDLEVGNELFVVDGKIITCAGGTAALDLALHLIRQHHGDELANSVSDQFIHGGLRSAADGQRMDARHRFGVAHPHLLSAIRLMEDAAEQPIPVAEIAQRIGISARQLERLFERHLKCSPSRHYARLRLEKARRLLRHSSLSVTEVALACGYESASHFSTSYSGHFGLSPSNDRRMTTPPLPAPTGGNGQARRQASSS